MKPRMLLLEICIILALTGCANAERQPTSYFGRWVIGPAFVVHSSPLSDQEIDALVGQPVAFSDIQVRIGREACRPRYRVEAISTEEFIWRCRMKPIEVGISGDFVTEIDIEDTAATTPFATVFVKDNDHLILTFEGVYFELRREE